MLIGAVPTGAVGPTGETGSAGPVVLAKGADGSTGAGPVAGSVLMGAVPIGAVGPVGVVALTGTVELVNGGVVMVELLVVLLATGMVAWKLGRT